MVQPGGRFYYSVPIGPQRIEFNAHRVFALSYLLGMFAGRLNLDTFAFVDDLGHFHRCSSLTEEDISNDCRCRYGCGIFELTKLGTSDGR